MWTGERKKEKRDGLRDWEGEEEREDAKEGIKILHHLRAWV